MTPSAKARLKLSCLLVASVHLLLVLFCFGAAIWGQWREAEWSPILVYFADMPASFLIGALRSLLHGSLSEGYVPSLVLDAGLFAVIGTAWWILIVQVVYRATVFIFSRVGAAKAK